MFSQNFYVRKFNTAVVNRFRHELSEACPQFFLLYKKLIFLVSVLLSKSNDNSLANINSDMIAATDDASDSESEFRVSRK